MEASRSLVKTDMINSFEDAARELNKVTPGSPATMEHAWNCAFSNMESAESTKNAGQG